MVIPYAAAKMNLPTLNLFAKKGLLEVPYPVSGVILLTLFMLAKKIPAL